MVAAASLAAWHPAACVGACICSSSPTEENAVRVTRVCVPGVLPGLLVQLTNECFLSFPHEFLFPDGFLVTCVIQPASGVTGSMARVCDGWIFSWKFGFCVVAKRGTMLCSTA